MGDENDLGSRFHLEGWAAEIPPLLDGYAAVLCAISPIRLGLLYTRSPDVLVQTKAHGLPYRFVQLLCGLDVDSTGLTEAGRTKLQRQCLVQVLRDIKSRMQDRKAAGETLTVLQTGHMPSTSNYVKHFPLKVNLRNVLQGVMGRFFRGSPSCLLLSVFACFYSSPTQDLLLLTSCRLMVRFLRGPSIAPIKCLLAAVL